MVISFVLQKEGLWQQCEHIWTFLPFVLLSAAVCLVLAGPVVEHVIQLTQSDVELVIRKEGVATDTAVVVSVCLVDKAFGRTFVSWPCRARRRSYLCLSEHQSFSVSFWALNFIGGMFPNVS